MINSLWVEGDVKRNGRARCDVAIHGGNVEIREKTAYIPFEPAKCNVTYI